MDDVKAGVREDYLLLGLKSELHKFSNGIVSAIRID